MSPRINDVASSSPSFLPYNLIIIPPFGETLMTETRKLRVFLCHSSQDKPLVQQIYQRLNAEGWIDPWLDAEKLLPGQDWDLEIEKAVERSDIILVCLSNGSISKEGYLQKELRMVLEMTLNMPEGAIFLIPLKLEECEIPRRLRTWQWLEFFPPANRAAAYKKLLESLKIRADKLNLPADSKTAEPVEIPPMREQPKLKEEPVAIHSDYSDLDLYIPPEYPRLAFVPPPAKVQTWTFGEMEFVKVLHGEFLMGSTNKDKDAFEGEKPQHKLNIPYDFLMARFPVTNALFRTFVKKASFKTKAEADGFGYTWNNEEWQKTNGANWLHPRGPETEITGLDNHPVVQVHWKDAHSFCAWLNQEYASNHPRGLVFRLPTEPEWEKSARGTDGRIFPWGNEFDPKNCNFRDDGPGRTTPIGLYSPHGDSPFGCADMAGNVWEWTASLWGKGSQKPDYGYPYVSRDGREDQRSGEDVYRILRGGSFDLVSRAVRAAVRYGSIGVGDRGGFRIVLSPDLS